MTTSNTSRILQLNLYREYFAAIANGSKTVEHRTRSKHWKQRLDCRDYDIVRFRNWYHPDAPTMDVEWQGTTRHWFRYAIQLCKVIRLERWPR